MLPAGWIFPSSLVPDGRDADALSMDEHPGGIPVPERADLTSATPNLPMAPARGRSAWVLLIAIGAVIVAGIVLAVALSGGGGTALPDELAGQARIESGPFAEVFEALEDGEVSGMSFDIAVYGGELQPRYLVMLLRGDIPAGNAESLLSSVPAGLVGNGQASIDFSEALTDEVDGVEYLCAPAADAASGQTMTMCMFRNDGGVGIVMATTEESLPRMLDLTKQVATGG